MRFPRACPMCNGPIKKQPSDELVVGMLTYCTATCRNLHLPSEYRRVKSLLLRALAAPRCPDAVRRLLVAALSTEGAHG